MDKNRNNMIYNIISEINTYNKHLYIVVVNGNACTLDYDEMCALKILRRSGEDAA